jgi:hypothetical protein
MSEYAPNDSQTSPKRLPAGTGRRSLGACGLIPDGVTLSSIGVLTTAVLTMT